MKLSQERLRKAKPWLFKDHNPPQATEAQLTLTDTASHQPSQQPAALPAPDASSDAVSSVSEDAPTASTSTALQLAPQANDGVLVSKDADRAVQRPKAPTDGYGTTGQESQTLDSWPHVNKSALYYDSSQRDVVPWTAAELADMVQGPPKQIKHSATRFASDFVTGSQTSKVCFTSLNL